MWTYIYMFLWVSKHSTWIVDLITLSHWSICVSNAYPFIPTKSIHKFLENIGCIPSVPKRSAYRGCVVPKGVLRLNMLQDISLTKGRLSRAHHLPDGLVLDCSLSGAVTVTHRDFSVLWKSNSFHYC